MYTFRLSIIESRNFRKELLITTLPHFSEYVVHIRQDSCSQNVPQLVYDKDFAF